MKMVTVEITASLNGILEKRITDLRRDADSKGRIPIERFLTFRKKPQELSRILVKAMEVGNELFVGHREIERYTMVKKVQIGQLTTDQPFVYLSFLEPIVNSYQASKDHSVQVASYKGVLYLLDGNHRTVYHILRGDTTIDSTVFSANRFEKDHISLGHGV